MGPFRIFFMDLSLSVMQDVRNCNYIDKKFTNFYRCLQYVRGTPL